MDALKNTNGETPAGKKGVESITRGGDFASHGRHQRTTLRAAGAGGGATATGLVLRLE